MSGISSRISRVAVLLAVAASPVSGQGSLTQEEALKLAFPTATAVERRTAFLSSRDVDSARRLAGQGVELRSGVVTYYTARRESTPLGTAYFDAHRVRTLPEVVMVVVSPQGTVDRVEVLKFSEPPQYRPRAAWLRQFLGKKLTRELSLRRDVANMTGATLTSRAVTDAIRRTLALHQVISVAGSGARTR